MEQQDQVQSVKTLGEFAQETTEISLNDVSVPYEFKNGAYYCEGLEGGYMSLTSLRRAWQLATKARKIKEARRIATGQGCATPRPEHIKEKARKEYQKWSKTEIK